MHTMVENPSQGYEITCFEITCKWLTNDLQMTYKWPANDVEMTCKWLEYDFDMTTLGVLKFF